MRWTFGRRLSVGVALIAGFHAVSALSMPVPERALSVGTIALSVSVLLAHAMMYWFGGHIRERFGIAIYATAQSAALVGIALAGVQPPVVLGVFAAFTAEMVVLARGTLGAMTVTFCGIALFVLTSLLTSDLYRAATSGLILAVTGLVVHAFATMLPRRFATPEPAVAPVDVPAAAPNNSRQSPAETGGLTERELEVLHELVAGARNSDIATTLGITERTVKAHVGSIYQKLGVQSRAAAVATAVRRNLV